MQSLVRERPAAAPAEHAALNHSLNLPLYSPAEIRLALNGLKRGSFKLLLHAQAAEITRQMANSQPLPLRHSAEAGAARPLNCKE